MDKMLQSVNGGSEIGSLFVCFFLLLMSCDFLKGGGLIVILFYMHEVIFYVDVMCFLSPISMSLSVSVVLVVSISAYVYVNVMYSVSVVVILSISAYAYVSAFVMFFCIMYLSLSLSSFLSKF